ncbi:hypothetical protein DERP_004479 [Dermatophagoides pteronyssinus]|uniref:Uncharacterized protein n=1 Tax=Dermatophagoides pteronyssinus TaxID=6956 RepID=A0ABQ8JNW2_DERPT|nr:hypothetical protein DERP_004479 [Dermatophagoides pteronyssinus]
MFIMRIDICTFLVNNQSASIDHHHQCKTYDDAIGYIESNVTVYNVLINISGGGGGGGCIYN